MDRSRGAAAALVAIGVLTGCGGSVSVVSDGGGSASASGGSTSSGACPSTLPAAGCPCAVPGLECEYGGANVAECDSVAYCGAAGWQVQGATAATGDCDSRPTGCPGTFASVPRDAG